jgi:uncharacterized membrane protein YqaE (UPF0057 family)
MDFQNPYLLIIFPQKPKFMKKMFTRLLLVVLAFSTIMPATFAASLPKLPSNDPDPATVKAAVAAFNSLPAKEKRQRFKEVKKALKQFKADKKAGKEPVASTVVQVIFAILIPPLGVFLHEGVINGRFWIDLLLTIIFYIPGMIYALIVVLGSNSKG